MGRPYPGTARQALPARNDRTALRYAQSRIAVEPLSLLEPFGSDRKRNHPGESSAALRYDAPEVQRIIQQGIEEAWRIEAKAYLPQRVDALCKTFGFRCGTVTIRNTRSRWGSCSSENNLSLSIHLMKLPDHLIDYVIVHELCHTLHKNHGAEFHQLLDRLTGGKHPQLRQELKNYTTRWR